MYIFVLYFKRYRYLLVHICSTVIYCHPPVHPVCMFHPVCVHMYRNDHASSERTHRGAIDRFSYNFVLVYFLFFYTTNQPTLVHIYSDVGAITPIPVGEIEFMNLFWFLLFF